MTVDWHHARMRLDEAAIPAESVILPGDQTSPWEGALRIVDTPAHGWVLDTLDYGRARPLLTRAAVEEVESALYAYLLSPLPTATIIGAGERERLLDWAAPHVLDLLARAENPLVIDAPAGLLVDRIGALDGFLLFPAGASFEARSLPVSALNQPVHEFVTATTIRFEVQRVAPWFGRPGGGLRFSVIEPGVGIRDLVREGRLTRLAESTEAPPIERE